jgi:D-tyrosyl-tRNA(Tyr) deacylase
LLAVAHDDTPKEAAWLAKKLAGLRIFTDENGKMNNSMLDIHGEALVISQFTLYGNCKKGRRPSFVGSGPPEMASRLYDNFCDLLAAEGVHVERGVFAADMAVSLVNDGPVTLILDTPESA